jgi:hypothetical protein
MRSSAMKQNNNNIKLNLQQYYRFFPLNFLNQNLSHIRRVETNFSSGEDYNKMERLLHWEELAAKQTEVVIVRLVLIGLIKPHPP